VITEREPQREWIERTVRSPEWTVPVQGDPASSAASGQFPNMAVVRCVSPAMETATEIKLQRSSTATRKDRDETDCKIPARGQRGLYLLCPSSGFLGQQAV